MFCIEPRSRGFDEDGRRACVFAHCGDRETQQYGDG